MSEQENKRENKTGEIDLSELSNLQFATAWTPSSSISPKTFSPRGSGSFKGPRRDGPRFGKPRDGGDFKKRPFKDRRDGSPRQDSDKPFKRRPKPFDKKAKREPFAFSMEVLFYPEDAPFNKLSDIMKASKRTYQLFDIAEIILEKPERFVVLAKNLPDAEGNAKPLYCAQPFNLPFEDEAAAKTAAVDAKFDELFVSEEIDAEPPKGEFQVVNRCSITGDLLGAPNWHKYGEAVREYHSRKFPKMPFEKFSASIESVRDADQIAAWLETMKKKTVFKLKEPQEGAPESFDTREAARAYISEKFGAELVRTYEQVRMRGEYVAKLPFGRIRRNIEEACRKQKKFPIVTANNLRGRLRRSGFTVYKRGSKGFAFVSTIKRKFIFEGESLSEVPQKIFDFITANPAIRAADLPYKYLGLEAPKSEAKSKTLAQEHSEGAGDARIPKARGKRGAARRNQGTPLLRMERARVAGVGRICGGIRRRHAPSKPLPAQAERQGAGSRPGSRSRKSGRRTDNRAQRKARERGRRYGGKIRGGFRPRGTLRKRRRTARGNPRRRGGNPCGIRRR